MNMQQDNGNNRCEIYWWRGQWKARPLTMGAWPPSPLEPPHVAWRDDVMCGAAEPPQVKAHYPSTLIVQLGSTVRLACPVYGSPRSLVSWTKDADTVHVGWQRFHQQRAGAWLYVTDVQPTDAGRYTCEATNGFGTATVTISLRVVRESVTTLYSPSRFTLSASQ